jgi:FkbM family methyltransferase
MLVRLRDHIYRIRHQIFNEPLNKGSKWHFLKRYILWKAFGKHGDRKWTISFENGMRSLVHPHPDHDAGELNIWTRNVDQQDTEIVRRVLEAGDMIVDVGCNVGNRTWALADIIGGALLIDANQRAIERVKENLVLNQLDPSDYHILQKAVGDTMGTVRFTDLGGANTLNHVVEPGYSDIKGPIVEVVMTTIDHEVERLGLHPTYIKVDVEGHDLNALKGARKTLRSGCVRLVKFEHNPLDPLQPLMDLFHDLGWMVFAQVNGALSRRAEHLAGSPNLFAAPKEVLNELQRPVAPVMGRQAL